ncbi:tripartite tricarboxylate transporter substrate-binding protein [Bordetella sp. BOR01]|uniref:tripartite tricarboxylate transporter substrate-binding protein n=1 Tax=Bordetella sp. BOR01 TaxID=2854779 RepID=UPI001C4662C9|nr:tripartite tricarboxylate transporter substrate-binding protein [Bordetella sp. BOR01]MBV7484524.1 tripartite tricarboxylate transporter substrate binding protein BugD [Bordetella sp. BOR01]
MNFRQPLTAALSVITLSIASAAYAADYPTRPITLIVPFAAGGPTDVVARTLGNELSKELGQPIVVENRTGAGGTLAATFVANAEPDGYTYLIHHNGMATATALYPNLKFDPLKSFAYVGEVVDVPMTLLGRKSLPPNNMAEFIQYAKSNADKINLANAGPGAVSQLCGSLLQQALGVKFTTIPYQGTGPAMAALLGEQVDVLCDQTTQTIPHIAAGNVKFYGVTTHDRISKLPDAPTLEEQGLKGFEVKVWHGIYAPAGTPAESVATFNKALQTALQSPAFTGKMADLGAEIVSKDRQTPESLQKWVKSEIDKWTPVLKAEGMNVN